MLRNSQSFLPAGSAEDYHAYLEDQAEVNMRGMSRVLNTADKGLVSFPYPAAFIKSIYREEY